MSEDPISGPNKWKNSTVAEVEELNGIDMQLYISGASASFRLTVNTRRPTKEPRFVALQVRHKFSLLLQRKFLRIVFFLPAQILQKGQR